ncbi:hypothetical protein [Methanobrevibacter sp.]
MELEDFNKILKDHTYTKDVHPKITNVIFEEPHEIFLNSIDLFNDIKEIAIIKSPNETIEIQLYDETENNQLTIDLDEIESLRIYTTSVEDLE